MRKVEQMAEEGDDRERVQSVTHGPLPRSGTRKARLLSYSSLGAINLSTIETKRS